jgi:hypothetical protein
MAAQDSLVCDVEWLSMAHVVVAQAGLISVVDLLAEQPVPIPIYDTAGLAHICAGTRPHLDRDSLTGGASPWIRQLEADRSRTRMLACDDGGGLVLLNVNGTAV